MCESSVRQSVAKASVVGAADVPSGRLSVAIVELVRFPKASLLKSRG